MKKNEDKKIDCILFQNYFSESVHVRNNKKISHLDNIEKLNYTIGKFLIKNFK